MIIPRLHHTDIIPEPLRGSVMALGNFDGFHLGHQAVAGAAIALAKSQGRPAIIATFDPHPVRHFVPDASPFRLTTLDQRQRLFAAAGADAMMVFDFGADTGPCRCSRWDSPANGRFYRRAARYLPLQMAASAKPQQQGNRPPAMLPEYGLN